MNTISLIGRALAVGVAVSLCAAATEPPTHTVRQLTVDAALKAASATLASCRKAGYQVAVAVVDRGGILQVLLRDRYAGPHTPDMASNKAWTAVSFRQATSIIAAETQPGKPMSGVRQLPRVIAAGGGLPIESGGQILGGIAVSGAPNGEADEACAKAGIKAIADDLEF
ncbi:MAG TPA: heme-binding protein [Usitatibacteraceae bacterium]|nr:heme-binding protein [Usitatibacteraceae bacterium]